MKKAATILLLLLACNFLYAGVKHEDYFNNPRYQNIFESGPGNKLFSSIQDIAYTYKIHSYLPDEAKEMPTVFFIDPNNRRIV